jgi:hypothetical protein
MNKKILSMILFFAVPFGISAATSKFDMLLRFNHEIHNAKVFEPKAIPCSQCHNFQVDPKTKRGTPNKDFSKSAFTSSFKTICHSCHNSSEKKDQTAPQACFTCHQNIEHFRAITPQNHLNVGWARTHSTNARGNGDSCLKCHTNYQCAQCHLRRNDIEFKNHSRNFRFIHSVEARLKPQTCDSCHSQSFCIDCHRGKK